MTHVGEHTTSLITFSGEDAADRMEQVIELAHGLGGRAVALVGAEWLGLSPEELQRQRALDTSLYSAILDVQDTDAALQLCRQMDHNGVMTVRDALVLGRDQSFFGWTLPRDRDLIDQALQHVCPNELWLDKPSVADVAKYCVSLDQVPAGVLSTYLNYLLRSRSEAARDRVSDFIPNEPNFYLEQYLEAEHYQACHREAIRFTAEFIAVKREAPPTD